MKYLIYGRGVDTFTQSVGFASANETQPRVTLFFSESKCIQRLTFRPFVNIPIAVPRYVKWSYLVINKRVYQFSCNHSFVTLEDRDRFGMIFFFQNDFGNCLVTLRESLEISTCSVSGMMGLVNFFLIHIRVTQLYITPRFSQENLIVQRKCEKMWVPFRYPTSLAFLGGGGDV